MRSEPKTRRIPRTKWAVPVPPRKKGEYPRANDIVQHMAYSEAERVLESLGFVLQAQTEGVSAREFKYIKQDKDERPSEIDALWAHPCGIAMTLRSYRLTDGKNGQPRERALSSMNMTVQFNCGAFFGNYKQASTISGSGGSALLMEGANMWYRSFRLGSISDPSLLDMLERIQSHSYFIPFSKWSDDKHLYLENGIFFKPPVEEANFGMEAKDLHEKYAQQERLAFQAAKPRMLPELAELIEEERAERKVIKLNDRPHFKAEDALGYFLETLEVAGICWPRPKEQQLLSHWAQRVADFGAPNDIASDRAAETGPAGLTYAGALLACVGREGNATRFLDLLATVDQALLETWCTQPDSSGLTLVSNMVAQAGNRHHDSGSRLASRAAPMEVFIEAIDIVVERLGATSLSLGNEALSVASLVRKSISLRKNEHSESEKLLVERMQQLISHALARGIAWGPETPSDATDFAYLEEKHGAWTGVEGLRSLWQAHHINAHTPQGVSTSSSRPRL